MQQFPGQSASELEMSISSFVLSLLYLGSLGCSLQDVPIPLATHDTIPVTFLDSERASTRLVLLINAHGGVLIPKTWQRLMVSSHNHRHLSFMYLVSFITHLLCLFNWASILAMV